MKTLITFAVDASGSMAGELNDVRKGYNQFVADQLAATQPGETLDFRLVMFDSNVKLLGDVRKLDDTNYRAGSMTALLDGVDAAIRLSDDFWITRPHTNDTKTYIVVFTDGGENSSTIKRPALLEKIEDRKAKWGWEFVFLGSGEGSWLEGKEFANTMTSFNFAGGNVAGVYAGASRSLTTSRTANVSYAAASATEPLLASAYVDPDDQPEA